MHVVHACNLAHLHACSCMHEEGALGACMHKKSNACMQLEVLHACINLGVFLNSKKQNTKTQSKTNQMNH